MFKSSWGRTGDHKLWSRVHRSVKESTSCGQEFMGVVKESTSCVQEFMGA